MFTHAVKTAEEVVEPNEAAAELLWENSYWDNLFNSTLKLQASDNREYKAHKKTCLHEDTLLLRRQFTLNVVGAQSYKDQGANFDYTTTPAVSFMDERNTQLPKEIQTSLHQFFGFLVYTYQVKKGIKTAIIHYDGSYSAYYEYLLRYHWDQLKHYAPIDGYTAQFLTYNPNKCIQEGIKNAIQAKTLPLPQKTYSKGKVTTYSGHGLTSYRELYLRSPNMQSMVDLVSLRIDPNNEYKIKNFGDLIDHIRSQPEGKATGTSDTDTSLRHMEINEEALKKILPLYADKTEIPGKVIYALATPQLTEKSSQEDKNIGKEGACEEKGTTSVSQSEEMPTLPLHADKIEIPGEVIHEPPLPTEQLSRQEEKKMPNESVNIGKVVLHLSSDGRSFKVLRDRQYPKESFPGAGPYAICSASDPIHPLLKEALACKTRQDSSDILHKIKADQTCGDSIKGFHHANNPKYGHIVYPADADHTCSVDEMLTFLQKIDKNECRKVHVTDKYSSQLDGQAKIYTQGLFNETQAWLDGKRKIFANFRAWWNNEGILFADTKSFLSGKRPFLANTRNYFFSSKVYIKEESCCASKLHTPT